eukprot:1106046_1
MFYGLYHHSQQPFTTECSISHYSRRKEVLSQGHIHLPNAGNATLSAAANSLVMFTEMVVNAGPNTRNIWIDCGSAGICNKMTINAQTAQFLSINLDGSTLTGPVDIYCPQNVITDNYKPYEA